ncbi:MAG: hypothetical protein LLG04_14735 [Parachlamydia sp.]|nr:hypothetical protein [Parachlamydia sp.]
MNPIDSPAHQKSESSIPLAENQTPRTTLQKINEVAALLEPIADMSIQSSKQPNSLPAYVINMPIKVDSDDEGASSDEDSDDRFPQEAFENPLEHFRLYPKDENPTLRGRVLEILTSNPNSTLRPNLPAVSVIKLCEREADSLQKGHPSTIHRLAMCVGFNKMRSLSKRRNNALNRSLNATHEERMPMGKLGFLWDGVWQRKTGKDWTPTTYEVVRSFYKQLKRRNYEQAKKFRFMIERSRGHMVPYREIRDTIKVHEETKRLVRQMRAEDKTRDVYITFLDSDIKSFHQHKGALSCFTVFDENYLQYPFAICSTGYTISEPDNRMLELGVLADMTVRNATAKHIRQGPYYPEPCTAVKVPANADTIPENFSNPLDRNYSSPQEMPRLIHAIVRNRRIDPQQDLRFDIRGAIITTTPARMHRQFVARQAVLSGMILWSLNDFKTMSDINQSHFNARDWALNLISALNIQRGITVPGTEWSVKDQKVLHDAVTSLLARLFNAFNPIHLARQQSRQNGSFQTSLIELLNSLEIEPKIERSPPRKPVSPRKKVNNQQQEAQRCAAINRLWQWIDAIDTLPDLAKALDLLLNQAGSSIKAETIVEAARECGRNLAALFKQKLCLNYPDLVVNALAEQLDSDFATISANIPPFYRKIMEGFTVEEGAVKTTKQAIAALPEFYGVTSLHIAALAGNLAFVNWLTRERWDLCRSQDIYHLYPLDYGLAHCKNEGTNLALLSMLWTPMDAQSLKYFSQAIMDALDDNSDRLNALDLLLQNKGTEVIQIQHPELDLLIQAVMSRYENLAERLFQCSGYPKELCEATHNASGLFIEAVKLGYDQLAEKLSEYADVESTVYDEMLDDAPDINEKLLPWGRLFGILEDIRSELGESDQMLFDSNLGNYSDIDQEPSEEEQEEYDEVEEVLAAGLKPAAAPYDEYAPPFSPSHLDDS